MRRSGARKHFRLTVLISAFVLSGLLAGSASASELIYSVSSKKLANRARVKVNKKGIAMITFVAKNRTQHVLARGAINARPPVQGGKQVAFKLDYKGGWGFFRKAKYWKKGFGRDVCGPYEGPFLYYEVDACTMPDGSHWAVQAWQRNLRTYGMRNRPGNTVWELRLSHWNTDLAVLEINTDWQVFGDPSTTERIYDHFWGKFTYLGNPVYGFKSKPSGATLDKWGRNIYLDTYNSAYGAGWKHENAFLTHDPTGSYCYSVLPHAGRPDGKIGKSNEKYRMKVPGPGVTPDIVAEFAPPGPFDQILEDESNLLQKALFEGDNPTRWADACRYE